MATPIVVQWVEIGVAGATSVVMPIALAHAVAGVAARAVGLLFSYIAIAFSPAPCLTAASVGLVSTTRLIEVALLKLKNRQQVVSQRFPHVPSLVLLRALHMLGTILLTTAFPALAIELVASAALNPVILLHSPWSVVVVIPGRVTIRLVQVVQAALLKVRIIQSACRIPLGRGILVELDSSML